MNKLRTKVENALKQDNTIVCDVSVVNETKPFSEEYMAYLGLTRNDLKKLERHGLAARRYTKNTWLEGEELPDGKLVPKGKTFQGKGRRLAWILLSNKASQERT